MSGQQSQPTDSRRREERDGISVKFGNNIGSLKARGRETGGSRAMRRTQRESLRYIGG